MNIRRLVQEALAHPRGTYKVVAALGELLTADAMTDLWLYQCTKGSQSVDPVVCERAWRRSDVIDKELMAAWAAFISETNGTGDHLAASAKVIPVLRKCAAELRGLLGDLDFYDDDALSPDMKPVNLDP